MRPRAVLLCDDVRTEDNRKELLIGVYSNGVVSNTRPAALTLVIYIVAETGGEATELHFELTVGGSKQTTKASVPKGVELANLRLPVQVFTENDDRIELRMKADGEPWSEPYTWNVSFSGEAAEMSEADRAKMHALMAAAIAS